MGKGSDAGRENGSQGTGGCSAASSAACQVIRQKVSGNAECCLHRWTCKGNVPFYGANRSGRWAGRLIQLQNLPQNHMPDLEQARSLVQCGDYDAMELLYDDIPDTLSQLIRTAFVPRDGMKFIVADFSAIEARVLSFLAGENGNQKHLRKAKIFIARLQVRCLGCLWKSTV